MLFGEFSLNVIVSVDLQTDTKYQERKGEWQTKNAVVVVSLIFRYQPANTSHWEEDTSKPQEHSEIPDVRQGLTCYWFLIFNTFHTRVASNSWLILCSDHVSCCFKVPAFLVYSNSCLWFFSGLVLWERSVAATSSSGVQLILCLVKFDIFLSCYLNKFLLNTFTEPLSAFGSK